MFLQLMNVFNIDFHYKMLHQNKKMPKLSYSLKLKLD